MKNFLALFFALLASAANAQVIPSGPWGSINYWGVGGASQVLNPGTAGQCLQTQGVGSAPIWVPCAVSSLSLLPSINTNQFYGNVSGQFAPPTGVDVNTILNTVGYDISRPPAVESILYKSNVGPNFNWQTLPPGLQGNILTSGGPTNPPFWTASPTQSNLASICTVVGALLYYDTPSASWKCLNPGSAGQVLQTGGAGANPSYLTLSATAPLVYSNGNFSAPGVAQLSANQSFSGNNTFSGQLIETGTSAPASASGATVVLGTVATPTLTNTGQAFVYNTAGNGAILQGDGSTNDVMLINKNGSATCFIPTGTQVFNCVNITLNNPLPISSGGTGAGTQSGAATNVFPTPTRAGDVAYWNGSNWVTVAGNNSGTQFLAENSSGAPSWTVPATTLPQGRLTYTAGVAVTTTDVVGATTIYYVCAPGNLFPLFNGSADSMSSISGCQFSDALPASSTGVVNSGGVFDEFAIAGFICHVTNGSGGGWASDTGGSNTARGTGYSQLSNARGYWTNANSLTHCYSGSTDKGPISANQATWLGTFSTTAAGVVEDSVANRYLYNAYNQAPRKMLRNEVAASWSYTGASNCRQANANTANQLNVVEGLAGAMAVVRAMAVINQATAAGSYETGIGADSTTVNSSDTFFYGGLDTNNDFRQTFASGAVSPGPGLHSIMWLECGTANTWTVTGTNGSTPVQAKSGISGEIWQ